MPIDRQATRYPSVTSRLSHPYVPMHGSLSESLIRFPCDATP